MKRHYTRTLTGFKCVSCRREFSARKEFAKHCGRNGECKHPMTLGYYIDLGTSPHHWTSTKPECYQQTA